MHIFAQRLAKSALTLAIAGLASQPASAAILSILHNNDGESRLLGETIDGSEYAGAARFVTAVNVTRAAAQADGRDVITLSSGDNFLAGPAFRASQNDGVFYDAQVINAIGYDALVLGNHDFDFGPDLLANFIQATDSGNTFLSANLDFSQEAALQALVDSGRIASSKIVTRGAERYGIVAATTEQLAQISSPGDVIVNAVTGAVQAEIDALEAQGVNKIIFASHLQRLDIDVEAISSLSGIDLVVAGGSDALLSNDLAPGQTDVFGQEVEGTYPLTRFNAETGDGFSGALITNADGVEVPVVTTTGEYRYLGRFDVTFDDAGNLASIDAGSGTILINEQFAPDTGIVDSVITPVSAAIEALAANVLGTSEVDLNGIRNDVRTQQTNVGALLTDSYIYAAEQADAADESILTGNRTLALTNGGGIRNNNIIEAGDITELNTFDIAPFGNFLSVFNDVDGEQLKGLLEHTIQFAPDTAAGQFAQVGGFIFTYDPNATFGERITSIVLGDGTTVFANGEFSFDGVFDLVTVDFLARGGDGYPFDALGFGEFENIGITYQASLADYIQFGLDGLISADL
ncbi:MAG: bifunctional metallophosphatase/5'-nucleotidase, partial [Pseudomonadota bacterium]